MFWLNIVRLFSWHGLRYRKCIISEPWLFLSSLLFFFDGNKISKTKFHKVCNVVNESPRKKICEKVLLPKIKVSSARQRPSLSLFLPHSLRLSPLFLSPALPLFFFCKIFAAIFRVCQKSVSHGNCLRGSRVKFDYHFCPFISIKKQKLK